MSNKLVVASWSVEPEMQDYIKNIAAEEGIPVSKLLRNLVEKYLINKHKITVIEHSHEFIPIVLKIPASLRGDPKVKDWLQIRCNAVAQKLLS